MTKVLKFQSLIPSDVPHPDKSKIIIYMRHGKKTAAAPGIPKDWLTGEHIPCGMICYEADGYLWTSMDLWHFDKYNFPLPDEFAEMAKPHYLNHISQRQEQRKEIGTKIYDGIVYAYVTVVKGEGTQDNLNYADGYIDSDTFQWETVTNVSDRELASLKNSRMIHFFVRKVDNEDGIQLPFTYIGTGHMEYIEGSKKTNGAHLFRIPMSVTAPEDIYFDFKLP